MIKTHSDWLCHFNFQCKDNEHGFCKRHVGEKLELLNLSKKDDCLLSMFLKSLRPLRPLPEGERLTDADLREKIWEIIDGEIETHIGAIYRAKDRDVKEHLKTQIKLRIQELLEKHEAILVYQP